MPSTPKPFLKWPGGKHRIAAAIIERLPKGRALVEPFVGGGSVFLATNYPRYILNDVNPDLIGLYKQVQSDPDYFIKRAKYYFASKYNSEAEFYRLREKFNRSENVLDRAILFLYFNRTAYNGLPRYSRAGAFNTPFGRYKTLTFPEAEIRAFSEKAQRAVFTCTDFTKAFQRARSGWVVYADPPYFPLTATANFTDYAPGGFGVQQQESLARLAEMYRDRGVSTLISNHDLRQTRVLYKEASLSFLQVHRSISGKVEKRGKVSELLALYSAR